MEIENLLSQLETLNQKAKPGKKKRIDKKATYRIYDGLCTIYLQLQSTERINIQLFFSDKDELLELLASYLETIASQAAKIAHSGDSSAAEALIRKALVIDGIIDGRVDAALVENAHNQILKVAQETHFDLAAFGKTLQVPPIDYFRRAQNLNQSYDRTNAARTLGHMLQVHPELAANEKVARLAGSVTGQPSETALHTLGSAFLCREYINELDTGKKPKIRPTFVDLDAIPETPKKMRQQRSTSTKWLTRIGLTCLGLVLMFIFTAGIYSLLNSSLPHNYTPTSRRWNINMMFFGFWGILMIIVGVMGAIRADVDLTYFLNSKTRSGKQFYIEYAGPAGVVVGLSWAASWLILMGTGLYYGDFIDSLGPLTDIVSEPLIGIALGTGMIIATFSAGEITKRITPRWI